jgi:hypothetical protein
MGKLVKLFYGLCFLIVVYIGFGFTLLPIILKNQIIKNLDENLTQKTTIEKIEFNPLILELKIHNFKISDSNDVTTLSFKEFLVDFSALRSIKQQNIRFKDIALKDLFVNIIEGKDGNINLMNLLKPSPNEEVQNNTEEKTSSDIAFLVSKFTLENANISYQKQSDTPYSLSLNDINYTLYDLGTYKNALTSNSLMLKLNEHTNITIGGAFKLKPFKAYGKVSIEDLRLKELLTYKKDMLNADLDENANLNLILNYNLDTSTNLDLKLSTDKFEFNNINLNQNKKPVVNLEKLDIKNSAFDLINQSISVDGINLESLKANMILDKNGINFSKIINQTAKKEEKVQQPTTTTKEETKPWNINLSNLKLNNSDFTFDDKINDSIAKTKAFNINLESLNIVGSNIDLTKLALENPNLTYTDNKNKLLISSKNANINLDKLKLKDEILDINSTILKVSNLDIDKTNELELKAKNLQLNVLNLINKKENLSINSIKLIEPNLNFLNTNDKTQVEAKNLDLEIKKLSNTKDGFKIEKTELSKPNISVILAKKDSTKTIKNEENIKVENKVVLKETKQTQTKLNIGPVNITNGIFSFEDKNLPLPFKTTVSKLNGKISEFKNNESSTTNLEVKGVVDEYGVAKITGIVHPNNIKLLTDINLIFNNIAVKNFTPYSGKFVGREIKSGKLDLDLKYNIQKSNLEAQNSIIISKLELGDKVESPDAVSLPLDIAISLLKNSDGIIDINLPVTGNIDDPQFAVGPIVWKAFVNLITKAVTAPFSLLGAMFNFNEDEIKSVKFNALEDEVTPIQKESLDKIAQILKARSEIAIELIPSYDANIEGYAQQKQSYLARKDDDRNLKKEDIEALILKEKIKIPNLEKIAKNRITNINNYLVKEKKINPKQIVLSNKIENTNSSINLNISKK